MITNLSKKPTWLEFFTVDSGKTYENKYGFDENGMWITGDAYDVSYPVRATFIFQETDICEIICTINHNNNCSDHSIALFNDGTDPYWSWGTHPSRIAFSINCEDPHIYGQSSAATGNEISYPAFYTLHITYNPNLSLVNLKVYSGYDTNGALLSNISINESLPSGNYKIGFDADMDSNINSYFQYLDIKKNGNSIIGVSNINRFNTIHPVYEFEVFTYTPQSLVALNPLPDSLEHLILNLKNTEVFIGNRKYKHGDRFTAYGKQAIYLKNNYVDSPNPVLRIYTEPVPSSGSLFTWGQNGYGQLGTNNSDDKSSPVQTISGGTDWVKFSCAWSSSFAIKSDGTLWSWGNNGDGRLGDGTTFDKSSPAQIGNSNDWSSVDGFDRSIGAIKTDGSLWVWGYNNFGNLGTNDTVVYLSPVQTICAGYDWSQAAFGYSHAAAIKEDGTLWCWGEGTFGNLGDNDSGNKSSPVQTICGGNNWAQVSTGGQFTAAIKTDGTLWTWGANFSGNLGTDDTVSRSSPVQTVIGGNDWLQVSCGYSFVSAIKTDGTLWTWGSNGDGQLGDNTTNNRSSPVQTYLGGSNWVKTKCGWNHTIASTNDNKLYVWGDNSNGQVGNNTTPDYTTPQEIVTSTTIFDFDGGYAFTGAIVS